ncbi:PQQ-dependent sugar dehydrogenase [Melissospora conviva]|uniref:PQQ-dependent sugar dehydrogenase n=1 Tax=Melissospora conviva TaxID=3388432 RepID=UPI003B7F7509
MIPHGHRIGRLARRTRTLAGFIAACLLAGVLSATNPAPAQAAPPDDFQTSLVVGTGLTGSTGFEIAPDGRIFILERAGTIQLVKDGRLLPRPFAVLPADPSGDRGLIGVTFDPDFGATNHWAYFYYTGRDLLNHVVRFDASTDIGSAGPVEIFRTQTPSQQLHVGGSLAFGPDGKLYVSVGDNGYAPNAQDLSNPHGKILRINKDGSVPSDNPFYGQSGRFDAIWAYGFRNPWRFQFDQSNGRLFAGDVGNFSWEEINRIVRGGNYGWPVHEGVCTSGCAGYVNPIHAYPHDGESAAVTAGPVYRGGLFPAAYRGNLFFGDYAKGFIKRAVLDAGGNVTAVHDFDVNVGSVVDLKVAPDGSLYYLTYFPGALYRIGYDTDSHVPVANATADRTTGVQPLTVRFSSAGSNDPDGDPLTYRWDFGDGTTSTAANPTKTYPDIGVHIAQLTVSDGRNSSLAQPIVIQVGIPPTVTIGTPADGARYRAGDTINYTAVAIDAAGFDLDDAAISTEVLLHHGTHFHPFLGPLTGRTGSFTIPTTGEAAADTWFEIIVTATDTNGLATTESVNIHPRTSQFRLATEPAGLGVLLDGTPVATPTTVQGVIGFEREIAAPPTAIAPDGRVFHFTGWSDGGAIRHRIVTPESTTTYTATYAPSPAFTGQYFANPTLSGTPALTRQDPQINFLWDHGAPAAGLPADNFSVRWSRTQYFAPARYRFTTVTDDGVRLYIDNRLVIDQWRPQAGTAHTALVDLEAGNHTIRMEYYEASKGAIAQLSWDSTTEQPGASFLAQYWNTPGAGSSPVFPTTAPAVRRQEPRVDHDWGSDAPVAGISADHFVARWTTTVSLEAGVYEFATTTDDGVRLVVDGLREIDRWVDQRVTTHTRRVLLSGGIHTIVMEYYENTKGAIAKLDWTRVGDPPAPAGYAAEYWSTPAAGSAPAIPTRSPDVIRDDAAIDFDWGRGAPAPRVGADHFVVRWTRTQTLPAGRYRLSGVSDDGIRVFVDNVPVINLWRDQSPTPYATEVALTGGAHTFRVEYYENAGTAVARFGFTRTGDL